MGPGTARGLEFCYKENQNHFDIMPKFMHRCVPGAGVQTVYLASLLLHTSACPLPIGSLYDLKATELHTCVLKRAQATVGALWCINGTPVHPVFMNFFVAHASRAYRGACGLVLDSAHLQYVSNPLPQSSV